MTAFMDMAAANATLRAHWGGDEDPMVKRFMEEQRELERRMAPLGPLPGWWRPFARRRWREAANKIHRGWALWCIRSMWVRAQP